MPENPPKYGRVCQGVLKYRWTPRGTVAQLFCDTHSSFLFGVPPAKIGFPTLKGNDQSDFHIIFLENRGLWQCAFCAVGSSGLLVGQHTHTHTCLGRSLEDSSSYRKSSRQTHFFCLKIVLVFSSCLFRLSRALYRFVCLW